MWLVLHVTNRCQRACDHCLRDPTDEPRDLDVTLLDKILDEARDLYRISHVGLTGGEPTLHPRFCQLVDAIVQRGMTWHLVTNGERFAERLLPQLAQRPTRRHALTMITFSLDGTCEETHDSLRGRGSYRAVMAAITQCRFQKLPFALQMTITRRNVDEAESFALVAARLGASEASFGMMQPTSTAMDKELGLPLEQWRRLHEELMRLAAAVRIPLHITESFPTGQPFSVCPPFRSETLHVDPSGALTLCCQLSETPGPKGPADALADLRTESLATGHQRMLDLIHQFQQEKLQRLCSGDITGWDECPCNYCLKQFGRSYWTDEGSVGPRARRERGRNAGPVAGDARPGDAPETGRE